MHVSSVQRTSSSELAEASKMVPLLGDESDSTASGLSHDTYIFEQTLFGP